MFEIVKHGKDIDFMGKRKLWAGLSVLFIALTFVLLATKGLNYGIDFTGGAEVQVKVPTGWDIGKVRNALSDGGLKDFKVQQIGVPAEMQYIIKMAGDEAHLNSVKETVESILKKDAPGGDYRIEKTDVVGAAAGSSLRMSGILSMIYAMICILIYVAIRFDTRYAPGAVLALFHDTMIVIGVFILTQKQFDLQILAAILALIGYSNNDTIIVFDRIREELHANPSMNIVKVVNKSINETLGRTILTSLCTFLVVFSLWIFGGKALEDFAFTLMVGIIVGTYSSVFIASSLVVFITEYQERRSVSAKATGSKRKSYAVRPDPKFTA
jgi:preprotein translocase subunit SecF